jgi:alkylation response protein AidB-like acyl-CoA dehydrogenase
VERSLDDVEAWAKATGAIAEPWVQQNLARVRAGTDVLRLFNWRQAWHISQGVLPPQEASAVKVYGSEFYVQAFRLLMEVLGERSTLRAGSPGALLKGRLERYYRATLVLTFGGGTNEVQRDIISMVGLGMPRPPR